MHTALLRARVLPVVLLTGVLSTSLSSRTSMLAGQLPPNPAPAAASQTLTRLADGRWLLVGGPAGTQAACKAWLVDATMTQRVEISAPVEWPCAAHTSTLLGDGRVLVFGGHDHANQVLETSRTFDPDTSTVEMLEPDPGSRRAGHTATLLSDGRVLIAGGRDNDQPRSDAQLWDPATGTSDTLSMRWGHVGHHAMLLPSGSVRLEDIGSTHAELFDPSNRRFVEPEGASADPNQVFLIASTPTDGASSVPMDLRLAMRFSRPLDPTSITDQTVLVSTTGGPQSVRLVSNGRLLFVRPIAGEWEPDTTYRVTLDGIFDSTHQAIARAEWSFTTRSRTDDSARRPTEDPGWTPDATSLQGGWQTGRSRSPWEELPLHRAAPGRTALAGRVLRLDGEPLSGVTLEMEGHLARTDATGRFLVDLGGVGKGRRELLIDGRPASQRRQTYGTFEVGLFITPGRTNPLTFTIWMPKLDTEHAIRIPSPTTQETVITTPLIPGLELRLPAGTVVRDHDGRVVREIGLTPVPRDRPPFPLPPNVDVPIYFTAQPGGAYIHAPGNVAARVIYPNYRRQPSGRRMAFWHYDPEDRGWYVYGEGSVTGDGSQIVPDAGVSIYEFTGAMVATPDLAPLLFPFDDTDDGDPVNLGTGLLIVHQVDLALADVIPLELVRTYRPADSRSRAFGIGATHPYDIFLTGDTNPYTYMDLVLPDGQRVHFTRINPGTGEDGIYEHTSSPTYFFKSRVERVVAGWRLVFVDGTVWTFPISEAASRPQQAALLTITDRHGNSVTMTRNGASDLTRITSPQGRYIDLSYDTSHRVIQATDNAGRSVGYTYDTSGRLWKVTDVTGGVTEYLYDTSHQLLSIKDARGIVYLTTEYDAAGRVRRQTFPSGAHYDFAYTLDTWGGVTQTDVTNPRGAIRRVTFNAAGLLVTDTRAVGQPEEQATTVERQSGSQFVTAIVDALGRRDTFAYNANGHLTSLTRLAGTAASVTTTATYGTPYDLPTSLTDALGHTTRLSYQGPGDLVDIEDPLHQHASLTYDTRGQLLSVTDSLGHATHFEYGFGDLIAVTSPLIRTWRRFSDPVGRPVALIDPAGRRTRLEYDSAGRPTHTIDALGAETTRTYDPNGNLLSLTDARGHTTNYVFDALDRLISRTDPLLREESYQYDENGNVRQVTDRKSQITTIAYDALDRPTQITFADASTISYTWDHGDRLTQIVDSISGSITGTYDGLDRLTSETTPLGTITYGFDAAGHRTSMVVPGEVGVSYAYDDAGHLTSLARGAVAVSMAYDPAGRTTSTTLPNGVVMAYAYDDDGAVAGITYTHAGAAMGALTYGYDNAGRPVSVGGSYARASLPAAMPSASYDAANQLTQWSAAPLSHDANGSLLDDGARTYTWNSRGELTGISGATNATFAYDALGRRTSRAVAGNTTTYLYDGLNAVQELNAGAVSANVLVGPGLDAIFARQDASGQQSVLTDALGSAIAAVNESGVPQVEYTYEPFGATASVGASGSTNQFTGRENDGTGLYFYRARYYDPHLQRFVAEDPLGFGGGDVNLYAYVQNSPTQLTDPLGLFPMHRPDCQPPGGRKPPPPWWKGALHALRCTDAGLPMPAGMAMGGAGAGAGGAGSGAGAGAGAAGKGAGAAAGRAAGNAAKRWRGFRQALGKLVGETPAGADAHHNLPIKFFDWFEQIGLNPNDPRFGAFWERASHLKNARQFNAEWAQWFERYGTTATADDALAFARRMAAKYGLPVTF